MARSKTADPLISFMQWANAIDPTVPPENDIRKAIYTTAAVIADDGFLIETNIDDTEFSIIYGSIVCQSR